jgi:archaellum component FlaF (FlaF/FlaG flagellin family)
MMRGVDHVAIIMTTCTGLYLSSLPDCAADAKSVSVGSSEATMTLSADGDLRTYDLHTTAPLRDNVPPTQRVTITEAASHANIRTGNVLFDGLYAMANAEALANSVAQISDLSYENGSPIKIDAFQTGELWKYVWTRDLSYSLYLSLAGFDPARARDSLLFKASGLKANVAGGFQSQIIQDTGSGGSYPVSTDRVVWAMGADKTLDYLSPKDRDAFLQQAYPILCNTIEQDRQLVFDPADGLYRGEQSFLDWREQTYPGWTKANVLPIAMSKALSVNACNYFLLKTAAKYSALLNRPAEQAKYSAWADDLKTAINRHLYDAKTGLYRTVLFSEDGSTSTPVDRYDLLGESLAILFGIADQTQAESIIANYPVGPYGPPVVWPQEKSVQIYHNQAIWPFVTAYWIKAAQKAGHVNAVDAGIQSLEHAAALNLSNMENLDFVSGRAMSNDGARKGPPINSRRQLWSVAAYLSMVQDTVFGMDVSADGIRFQPFITAKLRNENFDSTDTIELKNFVYQGTQNHVSVHLPTVGSITEGICEVDRVELNGKPVANNFVKADQLLPANSWNIYMKAPHAAIADAPLRVVDVTKDRNICGPLQPTWQNGPFGGLAVENGHIALNFNEDGSEDVTFNIYRDGELCAQGVKGTKWIDPNSDDYQTAVHSYAVAAVDSASGNVSHLSPVRALRTEGQKQVITAKDLQSKGGNLVANDHYENWGAPFDEIVTKSIQVKQPGKYLIRVQFANGSGPINTGLTCAVKKLQVLKAGSQDPVATGYIIMPQSGDWKRWDMSSSVAAVLNPGEQYTIRLSEDSASRNMSYMKNNEQYTAGVGGGDKSSNYANISSIYVLYSSSLKSPDKALNLGSIQKPASPAGN